MVVIIIRRHVNIFLIDGQQFQFETKYSTLINGATNLMSRYDGDIMIKLI